MCIAPYSSRCVDSLLLCVCGVPNAATAATPGKTAAPAAHPPSRRVRVLSNTRRFAGTPVHAVGDCCRPSTRPPSHLLRALSSAPRKNQLDILSASLKQHICALSFSLVLPYGPHDAQAHTPQCVALKLCLNIPPPPSSLCAKALPVANTALYVLDSCATNWSTVHSTVVCYYCGTARATACAHVAPHSALMCVQHRSKLLQYRHDGRFL